MTGCAMFTSYMPQFGKMISQAIETAAANDGDWSSVDLSKLDEMLSKFERHFYHHSKVRSPLPSFGRRDELDGFA